MKNDPISNIAMAGLYRTAVAVSALILSSSFAFAADPPVPRGNVSANLNPTTGYYVTNNTTLRLPDGVRATPSAGASTVTKYQGGLKQSIPTGITIDAIKKTAPLDVAVRAKTPALKNAAKGLLRGNVAGLALGAGLDQLFNGLDWVMGEGGQIQRKSDPVVSDYPVADYQRVNNATSHRNSNSDQPCSVLVDRYKTNSPTGSIPIGCSSPREVLLCPRTSGSLNLIGWVANKCYYGTKPLVTPDTIAPYVPVSNTELDDAIDNFYSPEPSDWTNLTPHLDLDDVEITWAPTLQGEPKTTTEYDADGNPHKIRETNIWYDFDIRDNPSSQPKLDVKKREETKTYEEGVLTGTTTTESTESAGSDDTPPPPPESPIDCDLFPTACAWFEWTKEEPVEPDDDLSTLLREVPIVSETYTITGGVAACPAPLVLDLSVFGSREVSYQPLCDLASTMKFLYLALMSFAAAVLLNRSINRV